MKAYCFKSGEIEFSNKEPAGAIVLLEGNKKTLKDKIQATARLAKDNKTLLVPFLPEAKNDNEAMQAVVNYTKILVR